MMIDPPIDKLIDKVGCKYALVCVTAKRAHFLMEKQGETLAEMSVNPVSKAAKEIYSGTVEVKTEE